MSRGNARRPNPAVYKNPVYLWWATCWAGSPGIAQPRLAVLHYVLAKTASTKEPDATVGLVLTRSKPPCEEDVQALERAIANLDPHFWAHHPHAEDGERQLLLDSIIHWWRYGIPWEGHGPKNPLTDAL